MSFAQGELLGQVTPPDDEPTVIYTAALRTEILLVSAVVLDSTATIELFHSDNGLTFDDSTLIYSASRDAGDPFIFQARGAGGGIMIKPGGSLAVRAGAGDAVTFSVYGITAKLAERIRGMG